MLQRGRGTPESVADLGNGSRQRNAISGRFVTGFAPFGMFPGQS